MKVSRPLEARFRGHWQTYRDESDVRERLGDLASFQEHFWPERRFPELSLRPWTQVESPFPQHGITVQFYPATAGFRTVSLHWRNVVGASTAAARDAVRSMPSFLAVIMSARP